LDLPGIEKGWTGKNAIWKKSFTCRKRGGAFPEKKKKKQRRDLFTLNEEGGRPLFFAKVGRGKGQSNYSQMKKKSSALAKENGHSCRRKSVQVSSKGGGKKMRFEEKSMRQRVNEKRSPW